MFKIACAAVAESADGRCRGRQTADGLCATHLRMKEEGKEIRTVENAGVVLVKFNLNENWTERARDARIPMGDDAISWIVRDSWRELQAAEIGREAFAYRDGRPDTGSLVFDPQVSEVSLSGLTDEMVGVGYRLVGLHLKLKQRGSVIITAWAKPEQVEEEAKISNSVSRFIDLCFSKTWGGCFVWSNPFHEKSGVVETVNLVAIRPDGVPQLRLCFADGLWAAESVA